MGKGPGRGAVRPPGRAASAMARAAAVQHEPKAGFGGGGWASHGEYMGDKTRKLREQLAETAGAAAAPPIFKGLTFWMTGRTSLPDQELKRMIVQHAGTYEQYGFTRVSHIIADNLAMGNQTWRDLSRRLKKNHVVTSAWVTDCVREQRRLPEVRYLPECFAASTKISAFFQASGSKPKAMATEHVVPLEAESSAADGLEVAPSVQSRRQATNRAAADSDHSAPQKFPQTICTSVLASCESRFSGEALLHREAAGPMAGTASCVLDEPTWLAAQRLSTGQSARKKQVVLKSHEDQVQPSSNPLPCWGTARSDMSVADVSLTAQRLEKHKPWRPPASDCRVLLRGQKRQSSDLTELPIEASGWTTERNCAQVASRPRTKEPTERSSEPSMHASALEVSGEVHDGLRDRSELSELLRELADAAAEQLRSAGHTVASLGLRVAAMLTEEWCGFADLPEQGADMVGVLENLASRAVVGLQLGDVSRVAVQLPLRTVSAATRTAAPNPYPRRGLSRSEVLSGFNLASVQEEQSCPHASEIASVQGEPRCFDAVSAHKEPILAAEPQVCGQTERKVAALVTEMRSCCGAGGLVAGMQLSAFAADLVTAPYDLGAASGAVETLLRRREFDVAVTTLRALRAAAAASASDPTAANVAAVEGFNKMLRDVGKVAARMMHGCRLPIDTLRVRDMSDASMRSEEGSIERDL